MQRISASFVLLALVALLGTSAVAGHEAIDQSHSKPLMVKAGRSVSTSTLELIFTKLTATPAVVNIVGRFNNNLVRTRRLALAHNNDNPSDDLQLRSAKMTPGFKPAVAPQVVKTVNETIMTWAIPREQIVVGQKYNFVVKVKVGPNVRSGDLLGVAFSSNDVSNIYTAGNIMKDFSPIVVK